MQYCLKLPKTVYSGENSLDKILEITGDDGDEPIDFDD